MKIIGLIGGISCESTSEYYRIINHKTNELLGKYHTAKIIIASVNFNEVVEAIYDDDWSNAEKIMIDAAQRLERAGVDFVAICSNTLYKVAPAIEQEVLLPLIHILEPTGHEIKKRKFNKIGLLGTKFTMDGDFHKKYLWDKFGIKTIIPNQVEKDIINDIIFNELCRGIIKDESRRILLNVVQSLEQQGAQGVVLGCTELPLLLPLPFGLKVPIFNTTKLHANAIVSRAIEDDRFKKFSFQKLTQPLIKMEA